MISRKQVVNKFQGEHKSWIPCEKNSYTRPVTCNKDQCDSLASYTGFSYLVWHAQCLSFSFLDKPRRNSLQKKMRSWSRTLNAFSFSERQASEFRLLL